MTKYRSECTCACHSGRVGMRHIVACCQPDPTNDAPVTVEQAVENARWLIANDSDNGWTSIRQETLRLLLEALASAPAVPREAIEAQLSAVEAMAAHTRWTGSPLLKGLTAYVRAMLASAPAKDGAEDEITVEHGTANSHVFDDRIVSREEGCIAFASEPWSSRMAAALARPRAAVETVEFVREWLMSGDHPVSDWERQFAAAIDARPRAAVGERGLLKQARDAIKDMLREDDGQAWKEARKLLPRIDAALKSPSAKVEGMPVADIHGAHMSHCFQGENEGGCKYGDDDCPAGVDQPRPLDTFPRDGSYFLLLGSQFDGGAAVVKWDDEIGNWLLDDGKNFEIPVRSDASANGWLPLPAACEKARVR